MSINQNNQENELIYTGIGSRKTPENILNEFKYIGRELANKGYLLRSGGSNGADRAFEIGCKYSNVNNNLGGNKNIFLPWQNFNDNKSLRYNINSEAFHLAKKYHKNWNNYSISVKKLLARDVFQVLGNKPVSEPIKSKFIICYTKNGKMIGGTAHAMIVAKTNNIPIYNFAFKRDSDQFYRDLNIISYDEYKKNNNRNYLEDIPYIDFNIYTSYFYNVTKLEYKNIVPVSISIYHPEWYIGEEMKILSPSYDILYKYKDGKINEKEYRVKFIEDKLSQLYYKPIFEELIKISKGHQGNLYRDIALVCYENREKFCHRHIVADYINSIIEGVYIREF